MICRSVLVNCKRKQNKMKKKQEIAFKVEKFCPTVYMLWDISIKDGLFSFLNFLIFELPGRFFPLNIIHLPDTLLLASVFAREVRQFRSKEMKWRILTEGTTSLAVEGHIIFKVEQPMKHKQLIIFTQNQTNTFRFEW